MTTRPAEPTAMDRPRVDPPAISTAQAATDTAASALAGAGNTARTIAGADDGFTLLELLVVIAILGLLVAFVAPQALKTLGFAKTSIAKQEITEFGTYFERFAVDVGRFPTTEEGVQALVEKPADVENWAGPYIRGGNNQKDPWGHPWIYRNPSVRQGQRDYDFCSPGPSGKGSEPGDSETICNP